MPKRKGPWKPPTYVGPPEEDPRNKQYVPIKPEGVNINGAKCPTCFDLDLRFIPQPHKDPRICSIGQAARHWIKSTDLEKHQDCPSCRFLKSAFDTLLNSGEVVDIPQEGKIRYSIAILDRNDNDSADDDSKTRIRNAASAYDSSQGLLVQLRCSAQKQGGKDEGFQEEFKVEIYTRPGEPSSLWRSVGTAGEVPLNPSAEECARIIKPWLHDCDQNHDICRLEWQAGTNNDVELLPKRVLDLSNENVLLVESSQGQRGRYVALSHCWGKEQLLTTTRDSIADRMQGIPWEKLPKTFQDAIAITRALGLRYIWIDSLCIIQQDKLDWEQQSAVMADIYSRCYLNIATTRAAGGHVGCLDARWTLRDSLKWAARFAREVSHGRATKKSEQITKTRKSPVKSYKVPNIEQNIYIRLAMESSHEALQTPRWIRSHANTAPLLPRGWVYQERFLSSRTVHMLANEIVWVCNVVQRCECKSLDGTPHDGDGWSASKDRLVKLRDTDNKAIHGLWRTVVEDFTLLDLTFESDRLPALGGLAYRFAQYLPKDERYLAGLWGGDLARDLLWESGGGQQTAGPTRERNMTAPSWSWASLGWGGDSAKAIDWEYETKPKLVKWAGSKTYHQDPRTKILEVSVNIDGENKYGIVKGGCITLEGALCAVVLGDSPRLSHPASLANVISVNKGIFNSLHLNYDTPKAAGSAGGIVYCLLIGSFHESFDDDPEPHIQHQGLILKPTREGKLERIGRWTQHIEDWVHNKDIWTKKSRVHKVSIV